MENTNQHLLKTLVIEAEKLAANGVKELVLIAQDLTYYGLDIYKKRNLAELLEALVKVEGSNGFVCIMHFQQDSRWMC